MYYKVNEIQEKKIINGGKGRIVKNTSLSIQKRTIEDPINFPNFKIIFTE